MGKGGRVKLTPIRSLLGRWGSFFTHRGQEILHVEPISPRVEAKTPDELRAQIKTLGEKSGKNLGGCGQLTHDFIVGHGTTRPVELPVVYEL